MGGKKIGDIIKRIFWGFMVALKGQNMLA